MFRLATETEVLFRPIPKPIPKGLFSFRPNRNSAETDIFGRKPIPKLFRSYPILCTIKTFIAFVIVNFISGNKSNIFYRISFNLFPLYLVKIKND